MKRSLDFFYVYISIVQGHKKKKKRPAINFSRRSRGRDNTACGDARKWGDGVPRQELSKEGRNPNSPKRRGKKPRFSPSSYPQNIRQTRWEKGRRRRRRRRLLTHAADSMTRATILNSCVYGRVAETCTQLLGSRGGGGVYTRESHTNLISIPSHEKRSHDATRR